MRVLNKLAVSMIIGLAAILVVQNGNCQTPAVNPDSLTSMDKIGIGVLAAGMLWIIKEIVITVLSIIKGKNGNIQIQPVVELYQENRHKMDEVLNTMNRQFEHYTSLLMKHDSILTSYESRIKHVENTMMDIMKTKHCANHGDTMNCMYTVKARVEQLGELNTKLDTMNEKLDLWKEEGMVHIHHEK